MTRNEFFKSLEETFSVCLEISRKKNQDYTGGQDPFANFRKSELIGISVEKGILVRMLDKISRVNTLLDTSAQVNDESIEDSLNDLVNYSAILKAYLETKKQKNSI